MATFILVSADYRDSLCRQLAARATALAQAEAVAEAAEQGRPVWPAANLSGPAMLANIVETAPTIDIPEIHTFCDPATGDMYSMCGWNQGDALARLQAEPGHTNVAWRWASSYVPFPGFGSVYEGHDGDSEQADQPNPSTEAAAAAALLLTPDAASELDEATLATLAERLAQAQEERRNRRSLTAASVPPDPDEPPF